MHSTDMNKIDGVFKASGQKNHVRELRLGHEYLKSRHDNDEFRADRSEKRYTSLRPLERRSCDKAFIRACYSLTSISTPAGKSSFIKASIVLEEG